MVGAVDRCACTTCANDAGCQRVLRLSLSICVCVCVQVCVTVRSVVLSQLCEKFDTFVNKQQIVAHEVTEKCFRKM